MSTSASVSPTALNALLAGSTQFALIDVREAGEYNSSHIPGASLIPRRSLEFQMAGAVPVKRVPIVVCDDDGRRAALAAATLERMGYTDVSVMGGGMNSWVTQGFPTEWGVNVPSKDFGERVQVEHHVPTIEPAELHDRVQRGDELIILDTRTPEEYRRFCIPGGRSVPGGELALHITDITKDLSRDATIVVNCAGRTRSIIGTRTLQRMGLTNVYGLENGTAGWLLAGLELETSANRVESQDVSPEGIAAAEAYADRLAEEDGVRLLTIGELQTRVAQREHETVYLVDVRTRGEYERGHVPGFRWFPGGQAVQRCDDLAVVKNGTVVFCCDRKARAIATASWYRQIGFREVYAVQGGTRAWAESGLPLEQGMSVAEPFGVAEAREEVRLISPQQLLSSPTPPTVIFVDTSQDFARGHVPGSQWVPRGWLELQIEGVARRKDAPVAVTCTDGLNSALAARALKELGYADVSVLDGGIEAWREAGLSLEAGLAGVMSSPTDVVPSGVDRSFADMVTYLRWEEALGAKHRPA